MIKSKAVQKAEKAAKPIEVGDSVNIQVPYVKSSSTMEGRGKKRHEVITKEDKVFDTDGTVTKIVGKKYHFTMFSVSVPTELNKVIETYYPKQYSTVGIVDAKYVHPTFLECGANPFSKEKRRINYYNQDISAVLSKAGYGRSGEDYESPTTSLKDIGKVNFDPYIIDDKGNRQHYQRGLVWTLQQKQLLIESIYEGIEIGKFLFRHNHWNRLEAERIESGHGYSFDCVDGKQRFFAILHFIQNQFPDSHGNYWKELSANSHRRLLNYANLSFGELPEDATDQDVIDNFLTLNHTGTPMSPEHLAYVKSLNVKQS